MRIVIGNLPDDISEEAIREALRPYAPAETIRPVNESGTPSALIEMEITRAQARCSQERRNQDADRCAWAPAMDWK
jgi:hypothetical protein